MRGFVRTGALLAIGICALVLSVPVMAQTTGAELRGKIVDESGGVLPGVSVIVKNIDTGAASTAVSEDQGQFRVPGLSPGAYEIRAELTGFSTVVRPRVELVIGQVAEITLTMKLGTMSETVLVTGEAPLVETSKSGMSNVVTKEQVASLPILGRSWQELALLTPGASQPTGTRGSFTAGGTSGRDPNVTVDGTDSNDAGTGSAALQYSQEAIREFNVMTNRFSAEYGRTQSAAVNVVTKSGTNQFSGSVFDFYRNEHLDSKDWFTGTKLEYSYRQIGGSFGGPVKKDRAHFFFVYENQQQNQMGSSNTGVAIFDVPTPVTTATHMSSGRLDFSPSGSHRGFIRGAWSQQRGTSSGSGKNTLQNRSGRNNTGYSIDFGENWVISSHIVNEFRAQRNRWFTGTVVNQPTGPEYNFPAAILGTGWRDPQGRYERRLEIRDDVSVSAGNHSIKFGVDSFPRVNWEIYIYQYGLGQFFFRTNPTNWTDKSTWPAPYQYTLGVGAFSLDGDLYIFNSYAQDDWKIHDRLTLNYGIRYDVAPGAAQEDYSIPGNKYYQPYPTDKNNWGPRVGANWVLGEKKNIVVRGGYGLYQGQFLFNQGFYKGLYNGIQNFTIVVSNPAGLSLTDPLGGRTPEEFKAQLRPGEINIVDPEIDTPHSHQASVGFQTELPHSMGFSADFAYVKGRNQYQWRDWNLNPNCIDVLHGCARPDPKYTRILAYGTPNESEYKALLVSLNRRFHDNFGFQVSYTLAKSMNYADDTAGSIPDPPSNPTDPSVDWGPALNDQRHLVVANASSGLPWGFRIGGILTAASGMPIKTVAGSDVNGDGSSAMDRPAGWERNSRRAGGVAKLDLRVSRVFALPGTVRIEPMLELYNLLNHHNYDSSTYGTTIGTARFGLPGASTSSYYHQRQAQLGFRVTF